MKLLLLDQFSDLGGAQQNLLELLPAIRDAGWSALIGLPGDGALFDRARALGFETARISCGPYRSGPKSPADLARFLGGTPRLAFQIRRLAARSAATLVFVNGPRLLPAAALAGLDCPVVFHSHSYLASGPQRRIVGEALRRLDAWVIGQCEFVAAAWRPFVRPERLSVIYNGVSAPCPSHSPNPARSLRVACIGRISPEKGQREFVAAASLIHQSLPECRFVIYGSPLFDDPAAQHYAAQVRAAAARLPIDFPGWVEDIPAALSQLDLLLVPSAGFEATTRVILEAFAAGVPVIAFPSGGIPEVIEDGVNGFLAPTPEEMAHRAIALLTTGAASAISRNARETWARRFNLDRYCRQVLDIIESAATTASR